MKRYVIIVLFFCVTYLISSVACNASETEGEAKEGLVDLGQLKPAEEEIPFDSVNLFQEEFVTKEIDGIVDTVGEDFIVIRDAKENQVKLVIDAETVIYVEDEKGELKDVSGGDNVFAFYIDEGGNFKCDLLDVVIE